jgi:hypothetical protein
VDLLQQNPSLAPKPAGGLPNMGYTTDRLGNIIRAPMAIPVFARGGDVDTNELLQRVNEYNLYGDDPAYYSESRNMLNALPVDETTYSESPSKIQVKRVRGQELRPKSSEGFGKGMAMEVESLTTSKGASPKALKGTAKDDFMELARTYKLKAKEAENMARGLSRDTFNAPTLERPTLTKGSLTKRRFEEGGEVKKSSQESEKEAGQQFDDPIRSGKPLQRRTRRAATQEENEALNRAVLQGAANMPYNLVGAPVDIANMVLTPAGLGSERPVMGSDWIKQKMTDLGVRPEMPTDPTQRALYSAADIGSSLVNPAAPVRAAAKGAEKAGEAARMLAEDFQQYNRQLAVPGASYAARPEGTNLMIRREGNPNWVGSFLDSGVRDAKSQLALITHTTDRSKLIEDFWNNKASNYFSKQFGTESDPIYRSIREQSLKSPGLAKDFPTYALDQLPVGKTRVNQETGESQFFPKYPEAWDAMREKYDQLTSISGVVPELNPSRVMDPSFTYSNSLEGRNIIETLRDKEIDKMIGQGTPATQANPNLEFLTRSLKDPNTVVGPYSAKTLLTDYEAATGTRIGDPDFRGIPTPEALPQNLRTAMEKGEIVYTTSGPDQAIRSLFDTHAINDFLIGLPERELKNIRFEDAVKGGAKISAKRMARETLEADIRAGKRVPDKFFSEGVSAPLLQFKEGPMEGFAWKRIEKADATVPEGAYVGHSVGGYAQGGAYGPEKHRQFNAGEVQVFTLRDIRNRPVNTVEVLMDPEAGPIVTQIKGNGRATGNTAPEKYDEAVLKFFQDYLKPVRIAESDTYLTPLLKAHKVALYDR